MKKAIHVRNDETGVKAIIIVEADTNVQAAKAVIGMFGYGTPWTWVGTEPAHNISVED